MCDSTMAGRVCTGRQEATNLNLVHMAGYDMTNVNDLTAVEMASRRKTMHALKALQAGECPVFFLRPVSRASRIRRFYVCVAHFSVWLCGQGCECTRRYCGSFYVPMSVVCSLEIVWACLGGMRASTRAAPWNSGAHTHLHWTCLCVWPPDAVLPGFATAKLRNFGMTIGVRDTRKIKGRHNLTAAEVFGQARCVGGMVLCLGLPAPSSSRVHVFLCRCGTCWMGPLHKQRPYDSYFGDGRCAKGHVAFVSRCVMSLVAQSVRHPIDPRSFLSLDLTTASACFPSLSTGTTSWYCQPRDGKSPERIQWNLAHSLTIVLMGGLMSCCTHVTIAEV